MKKLNNIYTYGDFVDVKNEGIWGAIKGMFKALFSKVSKKIETQINNFTAKIEGAKDWKAIQQVIIDDVTVTSTGINEEITNAKDLIDVRKIEYDTCISMYIKSADVSKKTGDGNLKPSVFLKDIKGYEKVFAYEKMEDFYKNLTVNVNAIVEANANQAGIDKNLIEEMKKAAIEKEAQAKPEAQTKPENASVNIEETDKLFEGDGTEENTDQTPNDSNSQEVGKDQDAENVTKQEDPKMSKLKETTKQQLTGLLKNISDKYKNYKFNGKIQDSEKGNLSNYTGKADGKVITGNPDTVKKMAQGLRTKDKIDLIKIRNVMDPEGDGSGKYGKL